MATKLKTKNNPKDLVFKESQVIVILEDMRDEIKIIAEGQIGLRQELKRDINDLRDEVKILAEGQVNLRQELKGDIGDLRDEMRSMNDEVRSNFKTVFEYLVKIDEEIQEIKLELTTLKESKLDKTLYLALEKRVLKAEKQIERMLIAQKIKK